MGWSLLAGRVESTLNRLITVSKLIFKVLFSIYIIAVLLGLSWSIVFLVNVLSRRRDENVRSLEPERIGIDRQMLYLVCVYDKDNVSWFLQLFRNKKKIIVIIIRGCNNGRQGEHCTI